MGATNTSLSFLAFDVNAALRKRDVTKTKLNTIKISKLKKKN